MMHLFLTPRISTRRRIADIIITLYKKPLFFCRNQMDATIEEEADNHGDNCNPQAIEGRVQENCKTEHCVPTKKIYLHAKFYSK